VYFNKTYKTEANSEALAIRIESVLGIAKRNMFQNRVEAPILYHIKNLSCSLKSDTVVHSVSDESSSYTYVRFYGTVG